MTTPLAPFPRTWQPNDFPLASRLRGDLSNAIAFLSARPNLVAARGLSTLAITSSVVPVPLDTEYLDNRNGHSIGTAIYTPTVAGWYLCEGMAECSGIAATETLTVGIQPDQGGTSLAINCSKWGSNGVNNVGGVAAQLLQLNPANPDTVELFAQASTTATLQNAQFKAEMVALPTTLGGGVNGTVVNPPVAAAAWAPGSGTTLTNPISAGATSIVVGASTGMVVGGSLGLNWAAIPTGTIPVSTTAEQVTITSVAGTTIGISAAQFAHVAAEPIVVPVSSAWMNQQVRNAINFLAYPPIASISNVAASPPSLVTSAFPAATAVSFTAAGEVVDNFGGWAISPNPTRYTFPIAGSYYVYGQVFLNTFIGTVCAGLRVNAGTTAWGVTTANTGATARSQCATVRRGALRVAAGDFVELMASQNSGASVPFVGSSAQFSNLIVVFRGF